MSLVTSSLIVDLAGGTDWMDVGTVNPPNPASEIIASSSGAVSITALRNIALASGWAAPMY